MYQFSVCPYNESHKFAEEKYFVHISRCKDGKKVQDKFATCRYHSLHILRKQDLESHELICSHRQITTRFNQELIDVYRQCKRISSVQSKKEEEDYLAMEDCIKKQEEERHMIALRDQGEENPQVSNEGRPGNMFDPHPVIANNSKQGEEEEIKMEQDSAQAGPPQCILQECQECSQTLVEISKMPKILDCFTLGRQKSLYKLLMKYKIVSDCSS